MANDSWRDKANRIIASISHEAYAKANRLPNGRMRKRHAQYSLPEVAHRLVDCLNRNDEQQAKTIFLYDYAVGTSG